MASVRKRNGAFVLDFYFYGYRFRKHFKTKDEAQELKNRLNHVLTIKHVSIAEAIEVYKKTESEPNKTKSNVVTENKFFWELTTFLNDECGISKADLVSDIKPFHMAQFQSWLKTQTYRGKPFSNSTINRRFNTIKGFFSKCVEWEFAPHSPCKFIKSLPESPKARKVWGGKELCSFRVHLTEFERDLFDFLLETGARLSSATRLTWQEVDIEQGFVTLRTRKGRERQYHVPLNIKAQTIILNQGPKPSGKVFKVSPGTFSKQIQRKIKAANLDGQGLTLHGLRHTFATRLHKKGASTEMIRRLLGHENTKTTQGYLATELDDLRALIS